MHTKTIIFIKFDYMKRIQDLVMGISFQGCHSKDTCFDDRPYSLFQGAPEKAQKTTSA